MNRLNTRLQNNFVSNSGVYAITADTQPPDVVLANIRTALDAGIDCLQYRRKNGRATLQEAAELKWLCDEYSVPFIVNDDVALSAELQCGLHIGRDDADLTAARQILGEAAIIGVSCYNDLAWALQAQSLGASYCAFGAVYPSSTKPSASRADSSTIQKALQQLAVPVVAIGGITAENARALFELEIQCDDRNKAVSAKSKNFKVAMIDGLWNAPGGIANCVKKIAAIN